MRIMNTDGEKILSILLNYDIEGNGGKPGTGCFTWAYDSSGGSCVRLKGQ